MNRKIYLSAIGLAGIIILSLIVHYRLKTGLPGRQLKGQDRGQEEPAPEQPRARIAIVIDDLGYNNSHLEQIFETGRPITLSILPHHTFSTQISSQARERGYECILHMPMEPSNKNTGLEPRMILTDMQTDEILGCLDAALKSVPEAAGISNHMGSKVTGNEDVMKVVLNRLKSAGLYFMDSLTTADSVCLQLCSQMKMGFVQRDVFLDGQPDEEYIQTQLRSLKELALKKGQAVGVAHDRDLSIKIINQMVPELEKEGIKFVFLSSLVEW